MAFLHYLQLMKYYRKWLLLIITGTTLITAAFSLFWLLSSSVYTASTKVMMLPSDSELAFTDVWLRGSEMSPATIMTETHIEYLLSRPVIERTVNKISEATDETKTETQGLSTQLSQLPSQLKESLRRIYHTLNYGEYVPLSPRQEAIDQLRRGIEVRAVEGSYLLEISVSYKNRETAALAANSLAKAYIEQVAAQAKENGLKQQTFLMAQINQREQEIANSIENEFQLREKEGIITLEEARSMLMSMQESQREKELNNQARLTELAVKLDALRETQRGVKSQQIQAKIEEEITLGAAEQKAITRSQPQRLRFIDDLVKEVNSLGGKERPLIALQRQRDRLEIDIIDLQKRLVVTELAASNAISKMRIVEPATPPRYPESPKVMVNIAIGLITGLLFALFILIALDTVSNKVITSADLRRLVGERFVGRLSQRELTLWPSRGKTFALSAAPVPDGLHIPFLKRQPDRWWSFSHGFWPRDNERQLRSSGLAIERQLTILGAFDMPTLEVTGFCSRTALQHAAALIDLALQSAGVTLLDSSTQSSAAHAGSNVSSIDGPTYQISAIRAISPVSAALQWQSLAARGAGLICIVPAGELNPQTLEEFQQKAIASGVKILAFVLIEGKM